MYSAKERCYANNGGCEQKCQDAAGGGVVCSCEDDCILMENGKSCKGIAVSVLHT